MRFLCNGQKVSKPLCPTIQIVMPRLVGAIFMYSSAQK